MATATESRGTFDDHLSNIMTFGSLAATPDDFEEKVRTYLAKHENMADKIQWEVRYDERDTEGLYPRYHIWINPLEVTFNAE